VRSEEKGDEEEIKEEKSVEDSMNEIVDAQKRQLDHWCFAEHYERKVLLQVMVYASDIEELTSDYNKSHVSNANMLLIDLYSNPVTLFNCEYHEIFCNIFLQVIK